MIETADLKLDVDTAWERIDGFGVVGDWHPLLERVESDGDEPGDRHRATGAAQPARAAASKSSN